MSFGLFLILWLENYFMNDITKEILNRIKGFHRCNKCGKYFSDTDCYPLFKDPSIFYCNKCYKEGVKIEEVMGLDDMTEYFYGKYSY